MHLELFHFITVQQTSDTMFLSSWSLSTQLSQARGQQEDTNWDPCASIWVKILVTQASSHRVAWASSFRKKVTWNFQEKGYLEQSHLLHRLAKGLPPWRLPKLAEVIAPQLIHFHPTPGDPSKCLPRFSQADWEQEVEPYAKEGKREKYGEF